MGYCSALGIIPARQQGRFGQVGTFRLETAPTPPSRSYRAGDVNVARAAHAAYQGLPRPLSLRLDTVQAFRPGRHEQRLKHACPRSYPVSYQKRKTGPLRAPF
jgi:hypothetical protein